jgi:hypothetical protein
MKTQSFTAELAGYGKLIRRMGKDQRLYATHISLFTALFVCWQRGGFVSPFSFNRRELMSCSRILSVATYHKCIRELDEYGYMRYQPSYHPKLGSLAYWPVWWELQAE